MATYKSDEKILLLGENPPLSLHLEKKTLYCLQEQESGDQSMATYKSDEKILLVGEGDLSFGLSLANLLGTAQNVTATFLDSQDLFNRKYKDSVGPSNVKSFQDLGGRVIYGVDCTVMKADDLNNLGKFHKIIYNFPHCGVLGKERDPDIVSKNQELLRGFLNSSMHMLLDGGEVHITHHTAYPYSNWDLPQLGKESGFELKGTPMFDVKKYEGYLPKRGVEPKAHKGFRFEDVATYCFVHPSAQEGCSETADQELIQLPNYDYSFFN